MTLKVKISQILCIFVMLVAAPHFTAATDTAIVENLSKGLENFGVRLFTELAEKDPKKNVVFSPFSIQTCLAMARMGAAGKTADEIDQGLTLSAQNRTDLANYYHNILKQYQDSSILKMANKIYAMEGYTLQEEFSELLSKQFFSTPESIDFRKSKEAAETINSWVEGKTNNLIKNLVDPSLLDNLTRLVLVNAIYFKGNWVHQFQEGATRDKEFYLDETNKITVPMMHVKENFNYGELDNLDAKILEMRYKDSDLSMLVILPNKRSGLVELEHKLKNVSISDLVANMYSTKVIVDMPKFKAEFQAELSQPLAKLGLQRMFTKDADFSNMLKSDERLKVSSVIHKAYIEVNERGTEAAAATGSIVLQVRPSMERPETFNVNKPFIFLITNLKGVVLFNGAIQHVNK